MSFSENVALAPSPSAPVLARLSRRDFWVAHAAPGFARWNRYRDFRQERDALYVGYGAAGVTAALQAVPFGAFQRWSRLTGVAIDLDELDAFAALWRWRAAHPEARIRGSSERGVAEDRCVFVHPEVFARWARDFSASGLFLAPDLDSYATQAVECCIDLKRLTRRPSVSSS